jgi:hypothetical protein
MEEGENRATMLELRPKSTLPESGVLRPLLLVASIAWSSLLGLLVLGSLLGPLDVTVGRAAIRVLPPNFLLYAVSGPLLLLPLLFPGLRALLKIRLDILALVSVFTFSTTVYQRPFTLFEGDNYHLWAGAAFLVSIALTTLLRHRVPVLAHIMLVGGMGYGLWAFLDAAAGRLLFSDDHAAFLLRIMQLKEQFPFIPFYSPLWNAGYDAREFFPSGCLNFFFLFAPLIYLFEVREIYTLLIGLLLFVCLPLSIYLAALLLRVRATSRALAALLVLTASLFWYRWALVYGTLGFITSCVFLLPAYALWTRLIASDEEFSPLSVSLTVVCSTCALFWTPAGLTLLPFAIIGLFRLRRLLKKPSLLVTCVLLVACNLPWMTLFIHSSRVISFVSSAKHTAVPPHQHVSVSKADDPTSSSFITTTHDLLREQANAFNPFILLVGSFGCLTAFRRKRGYPLALIAAWLLFLALVVGPLKPQLELNRMFVLLALVLTLLTGSTVDEFLHGKETTASARATLLCSAFGYCILGFFPLTVIIRNRSSLAYHYAEPIVDEVTDAILTHHNGGRVLFAGFSLHELSYGHLAPLSLFTRVPLIASSYQHNLWRYTDAIPGRFRKRGEAGIFEYLNLMNVTTVVTHDSRWMKWFRNRPEYFERVWGSGRFTFYRRKGYTSNYFIEGAGSIAQQEDSFVSLWLQGSEAVVKFRYLPFLTSTRCTVSPYPVTKAITFTRLSNCPPGSEVRIESMSPLKRLLASISASTLSPRNQTEDET